MPQPPLGFAELPLFSQLDADELSEVIAELQPGLAGAGMVLIGEGDPPGHPLYILRRGRVAITKRGPSGKPHWLNTLAAPSVFGEMEVLATRPAIATIVTQETVVFATLSSDSIRKLCKNERPCILKVLHTVVATLRLRARATEARVQGAVPYTPQQPTLVGQLLSGTWA
jgi:CRP/FNR family transcriptional regulator, cyclic AMP receptor protein